MNGDDVDAKAQQAWARFTREADLRALRFGPRPPKPPDNKKRKLPKQPVPAVSITSPVELERYIAHFRGVFRYRSTRQQGLLYLLGLLSDLERKNGETMEAGIPGATQQGVWDFLVRSPWSAPALDEARTMHYLSACGVAGCAVDIVIDEVSVVKQGTLSVGVARQYLGCVGKTGNGQVTVTLHGVIGPYDLPLCGQLYLPEAWAGDAQRRKQGRIPEEVVFQTKPQISGRSDRVPICREGPQPDDREPGRGRPPLRTSHGSRCTGPGEAGAGSYGRLIRKATTSACSPNHF